MNSTQYSEYNIIAGKENHLEAGRGNLVMGAENRVNAKHSAAIGRGLEVRGNESVVIGRYNSNTYHSGSIFTVGNGVGPSYGNRSNALEVYSNGRTSVIGSLTVSTHSLGKAFEVKQDGSTLMKREVVIEGDTQIGKNDQSTITTLNGHVVLGERQGDISMGNFGPLGN